MSERIASDFPWINWNGIEYKSARELIIERSREQGVRDFEVLAVERADEEDTFLVTHTTPNSETIRTLTINLKEPSKPVTEQTWKTKVTCPRCGNNIGAEWTFTFTEVINPEFPRINGYNREPGIRTSTTPSITLAPHNCYQGMKEYAPGTVVKGVRLNGVSLHDGVFEMTNDHRWLLLNTETYLAMPFVSVTEVLTVPDAK